MFTGSATALFGNWIKWLALSFVTLGIYLFWVTPRIARWKWEHTDFDRGRTPLPLTDATQVVSVAPAYGLPMPSMPVLPQQR